MGILICTECKKKVSDKAEKCPHCGCPIDEILTKTKENEETARKVKELREKVLEEKKQNKKEVSPKVKKRIILGVISSVVILSIIGVALWMTLYKIPSDKAYKTYQSSVENYNLEVATYNDTLEKYKELDNMLAEKNTELDDAIDSANQLLGSGRVAYNDATAVVLISAIDGAKKAKIDNLESISDFERITEDTTLKGKKAEIIDNETDIIDGQKNIVIDKKTSIEKIVNETVIPDYSKEINALEVACTNFDASCKIQEQITAPSDEWIVERLERVEGVVHVACATEENDPNGLLGKEGGYTTKAFFSSNILNGSSSEGDALIAQGMDAGGTIEVYTTVDYANQRNEYLSAFDGSFLKVGKHVVLGTIVIRISDYMTASQQDELTNLIIEEFLKPE